MTTIARRTNAKDISFFAGGSINRGYIFSPSSITSNDDKEFIFNSLFPVGVEAFCQNASESFEDSVYEHIFNSDGLIVVRSDGTISFSTFEFGKPRPIAFRMWRKFNTPYGKAIYLSGMCVLPQWQGMGIGQQMTRLAIDSEGFDVVFTVTQNPIAKQSMDSAIGMISQPGFTGMIDLKKAQYLLSLVSKSSLNAEGIIKGHYGSTLYGMEPKSKDAYYTQQFNRLNKKEGDAIICYADIGGRTFKINTGIYSSKNEYKHPRMSV